ncbi:hypothetical protein DPMN_041962 [Dreissena polymorpha]|uniref:Uncharacterized protein n=1 Tax=Dreissena polymorpha TaxID=45954 RepID=A0A9D4CXU3_DREPO|nr:hypothetical protein DPMN_041962 [Dreissena polymorpha]
MAVTNIYPEVYFLCKCCQFFQVPWTQTCLLTETGDCCETKIQVVRVHFPREEATDPCLDYQMHQNRQDALRSLQNFAVPTQRAYWHRHLHPDRFSKPHEEDCVVLCQISNIVHESESCLWIWQTHTCTRKYQP